MSKLTYKRVSINDYNELLVLYNDSYYDYATGKKRLYINSLDKYNDGNNFYYVVRKEGEFIGCIKGFINEDKLWISMLMISKKYLSMGYGRSITNTTINIINERYNINYVYITIAKENHIAIWFWEKLGFSYVKKIKENVFVYKKQIH